MLLVNAWYRGSPWLRLLQPLAAGFGWFSRRRRRRLLAGQRDLPLPMIVVGNITVGGTGKTPVVLGLAQALQAAGYRPGIVTRGYGARPTTLPWPVKENDDPQQAGDEPLLLARRSGLPVVLDPDRCRAVRHLAEHTDCDVIISDDGLQHYAMARLAEIVVVDGRRGLGNARLLPAGPLRESAQRLREVDAVLVNGEPGRDVVRQLDGSGWQSMTLTPRAWVNLRDGRRLAPDALQNTNSMVATAGIGHPERFFTLLRSLGYTAEWHPFPDHHHFRREDLAFAADRTLVMTEKDAVKCREWAEADWWYLEVAVVLPDEVLQTVQGRLREWAAARTDDR
ncbi:MAG: tetraacyldisaccharide 4'-kinase [Pseudohongiellaceae bacterium]